jgi:FtsH-binding integral membrane protein
MVIDAPASERVAFIKRTYLHLAVAVYALVALEWALFTFVGDAVAPLLAGQYSWLIALGAFMLVSHLAHRWAQSSTSLATQYLGLGAYVVAEALILYPLLWIADRFGGDVTFGGTAVGVIPLAAGITAAIFALLTVVVFATRKDFSFLGPALTIAGFAAMGLIVVSIFAGFNLGVLFAFGMVGFAACYILYDTSNILHHYRTEQHVAASLALFASVALLFWYVLRIVMAFANRD